MFMQWKNLEDTKERSKDNPLCICIKYATYLKHFKNTLRFSPNEKKWCDLHMFLSVITWFHTAFSKVKRKSRPLRCASKMGTKDYFHIPTKCHHPSTKSFIWKSLKGGLFDGMKWPLPYKMLSYLAWVFINQHYHQIYFLG